MSALFKRRDYPRLCDVCGHRWMFSQLRYIGLGRYACPDDKGMLTREQIARHMARPIPQLFRPRKHPRPMVDTAATYQATEAEHLRIAATYALAASQVDIQGTVTAGLQYMMTATAAVYLADIALEGLRPDTWRTLAKTTALSIADSLIARQYGSATGPAPGEATTSCRYGGILASNNTTLISLDAAFSGLAFIRAYQLSGFTKYLDAADRLGHYLRNLQRIDQWATNYTTSSLAGSDRFYVGGWALTVTTAKVPDVTMRTSRSVPLWFFAELRKIRGGAAVYGSTGGGDFVSSITGTIDTIIADALAFYVTGKVREAGWATPLAPLSVVTPRREYRAFLSTGGGDGLFHLNGTPETIMLAFDFGLALRSVFEAVGYSPEVTAIYEWLMEFSSNPAFATAATSITSKVQNAITGTYDPTFALAAQLTVRNADLTPAATNASSDYQVSASGLLAPIHLASGRSLKALKDELDRKKPIHGTAGPAGHWETVLPGPTDDMNATIGALGLGLQSNNSKYSVWGAALVGMLYRYQPQSWNGVSVF